MTAAAGPIVLLPADTIRKRGDHWTSDKPKNFKNPWPSAKSNITAWNIGKFIYSLNRDSANDPDIENAHNLIPSVKPDFGVSQPSTKLKSTWLGHAAFLVEMPSEQGRGVSILFDPAFSQRCGPSQSFGMTPRYTQPPATVDELPEVDIIVISHNHYDHCDLNTLGELYKKHASRPPLLFVPLANAPTFKGIVPDECVIECDWWDTRDVQVQGKGVTRITCTPSQHTCKRSLFDADHALWSSWAVQEIKDGKIGASLWHGGDTGYCSVDDETHEIDPDRPVCPAFKEIGERVGPFTVGLIPIGAYKPRRLMSYCHNAPIDSVRMFKDIKCKQAVGMHWGSWRMAADRIAEPPVLLREARKVVGLTEDEFSVCALGETRCY